MRTLICAHTEKRALHVEHQELSARVLVSPVREGEQHFLQRAAGGDLFSGVVVVLPEVTTHVPLYCQPLAI